MNYGIPYMGSKNSIAPNIIKYLPSGERLVDLFGGGFAITHCAMLSKKWKYFLYNDFNPLVVNLVKEAYEGKYNYKKFKPKFITREEFEKKKDKDGYIKYIWSFGNNGKGYLLGKDIEHYKHLLHDLVIFDKKSEELENLFQGINRAIKSRDVESRRIELQNFIKKKFGNRKAGLERLQQLERLQRLQQLERLQRLEFSNISYKDYKYKKGDIVYLDPPYEDTAEYSGGFNHKEFYDWVASRPYQVWFSSYKISDNRFKMVWAKLKRSILSSNKDNNLYNFECIYTNKE